MSDIVLDRVEEAIYELMRGKVVIVVDDEDRRMKEISWHLRKRRRPK